MGSAVPGQERASSSRFALTKGIVCTTLFWLPHYSTVLFYCITFEHDRSFFCTKFMVTNDG